MSEETKPTNRIIKRIRRPKPTTDVVETDSATSQPSADLKAITLSKALNDPRNIQTKNTLIKTSIMMVILPLLTFFTAKHFFFYGPDWTLNETLTYSGFAAVGAVNIICAGYVIYSIWFEELDDDYTDINFVHASELPSHFEKLQKEKDEQDKKNDGNNNDTQNTSDKQPDSSNTQKRSSSRRRGTTSLDKSNESELDTPLQQHPKND